MVTIHVWEQQQHMHGPKIRQFRSLITVYSAADPGDAAKDRYGQNDDTAHLFLAALYFTF